MFGFDAIIVHRDRHPQRAPKHAYRDAARLVRRAAAANFVRIDAGDRARPEIDVLEGDGIIAQLEADRFDPMLLNAVSLWPHRDRCGLRLHLAGRPRTDDLSDLDRFVRLTEIVIDAVLRPDDDEMLERALLIQDGICATLSHVAGVPQSCITLGLPGPVSDLGASIWHPDRAERADWTAGPDHAPWCRYGHLAVRDEVNLLDGLRISVRSPPSHSGPQDPDPMRTLRALAALPPAPTPVISPSDWGPPF